MPKTITVYTPQELKERDLDAFNAAFQRYKDEQMDCPIVPWEQETIESLKALIKAIDGVELVDWRLGTEEHRNFIRLKFDNDDVRHLSGSRAMAWLENNLLTNLRIPFKGKRRWDVAKYGKPYRPGKIEPCPFTGYCVDDDLLDVLTENIVDNGMCVEDALHDLAREVGSILYNEWEWILSEEAFLEQPVLLTEDGEMIHE